jgi:hypothetical protein
VWALGTERIHFLLGYLTTLFHLLSISRNPEVQFHKELKDYLSGTSMFERTFRCLLYNLLISVAPQLNEILNSHTCGFMIKKGPTFPSKSESILRNVQEQD